MMNAVEAPPDETRLWFLEHCLVDAGIPDVVITPLTQVVAPNGLPELPELVQCRAALRGLESLARCGRVELSSYETLLWLLERSAVLRAPGVDARRLRCSHDLLLEVQTAAVIQHVLDNPFATAEELHRVLGAAFPLPHAPATNLRAQELADLVQGRGFPDPIQGRGVLVQRYPLNRTVADLLEFVGQAKQALGPTIIQLIIDDINAGRYMPGEAALAPPPPAPAPAAGAAGFFGLGQAAQQQRQQYGSGAPPAWNASARQQQSPPGRSGRQMQQTSNPQRSVLASPVAITRRSPVRSMVPPHYGLAASPGLPPLSGEPSPALSYGAGEGEGLGRKRARPEGEEGGGRGDPRLRDATDQLHETGGPDPLPDALEDARAAQEDVAMLPASPGRRRREGEGAERPPAPAAGVQLRWDDDSLGGGDDDFDIDARPAPRMPAAAQQPRKAQLPLQPVRSPAAGGTQLGKPRRKNGRWSEEETDTLIILVTEYGEGNWADMYRDERSVNILQAKRTQVDLKDKWRNLKKSGLSGDTEVARKIREAQEAKLAADLEREEEAARREAEREAGEGSDDDIEDEDDGAEESDGEPEPEVDGEQQGDSQGQPAEEGEAAPASAGRAAPRGNAKRRGRRRRVLQEAEAAEGAPSGSGGQRTRSQGKAVDAEEAAAGSGDGKGSFKDSDDDDSDGEPMQDALETLGTQQEHSLDEEEVDAEADAEEAEADREEAELVLQDTQEPSQGEEEAGDGEADE